MAHTNVYCYYDVDGNLTEWVVSDDSWYVPSERPGMVRVDISRQDYDALPKPLNVDGVAVHHDMNKACVTALLKADPTRGAKLQDSIAAADSLIAAQAKAQADAQAEWDAFPLAYRQFVLALPPSDTDTPTLADFLAAQVVIGP